MEETKRVLSTGGSGGNGSAASFWQDCTVIVIIKMENKKLNFLIVEIVKTTRYLEKTRVATSVQ